MKVIILLAGQGSRMRPSSWSRPKALLHLAGGTVIGHLLDLLEEVTTEEVIFVVGYKGDEIEAWLRAHYGHLDLHFVQQPEARGQADAVWRCGDYLTPGEPVLIAFGDAIIKADFGDMPAADGVVYVQEVEDPRAYGVVALDEAGVITRFVEKPATDENRLAIVAPYWFRDGAAFWQHVDAMIQADDLNHGEFYLADAAQRYVDAGARLITRPVEQWADTGQPEELLRANTRLLALGYGSEDALERSFGENFTVIPPVFLADTADIENAVIGPYVSVAPGAIVRDAVLRECVVDEDAVVERCHLERSLIGPRARVIGRFKQLHVGADAVVDSA